MTIVHLRAGPPPPVDTRGKFSDETGFHAPIDTTTQPFSFGGGKEPEQRKLPWVAKAGIAIAVVAAVVVGARLHFGWLT